MNIDEKISMDGIFALNDAHSTKGAGTKVATVLGIIGAIIVLAILWHTFNRNREGLFGSDKNTSVEIGELRAGQRYLNEGLVAVSHNERADALRIAYTDGKLQPYAFAAGYGDYQYGGGIYGDRRCGCEHGHGHCGAKFSEVKTFTPSTDVVTLTSNCNCG